ncbi:MAG: hypothetical protein H7196_01340 [candidate division SR1 bacterium]|nr:hypothetical protein [candidate division SR1 bacterium]
MNLITNLIQSFRNDPIFRRKVFVVIASFLLISILISGFIWLNFSKTTYDQKKVQIQDTNPVKFKNEKKENVVVTANDFDNTSYFKKVGNELIAYPNQVFITNQNIAFINDKYYFTNNDKPVVTPIPYSASNFLAGKDGIVINETGGSSIFTNEQIIKGFPDRIIQVTPVLADSLNEKSAVYYFIDLNDKVIHISKANKIDLSDKTIVTDVIIPKDKKYESLELRQLGKSVYMFGFEKSIKEGKIDIFLVEQNKLTIQKELQNIESFQYGKSQIVYTDLPSNADLLTQYRTNIMDFSSSKLDIFNIEISKRLTGEGVKGGLFANRCNFNDENANILYCLIKKNAKQYNLTQEPDAIVKIEWKNNKISYILKDSIFSASSIYSINDKNLYFTGQENKNIYKINNVDSQ